MREISLDEAPTTIPIYTCVNYGDTRTGKTVFGATWPRPLIIADAMERGYESIKTMDRSWWFEEDVKPIVWAVDNQADLMMILAKADPMIASGQIVTLVIDAMSFYCDFYLNAIFNAQSKHDTRAAYGALGVHLRNARVQVHNRGTNVLWNCLAKHPEKDDETGSVVAGGPLIPGQQGDKFSAGVDLLFHSRLEPIRDAGKVVGDRHEIRTRKYKSSYPAGNRLGARGEALPDPFIDGTYNALISYLGHDPDEIRARLKTYRPSGAIVAPPTVVAKPPVITAKPPVITMKPTPSAPKVVTPLGGNNKPVIKTTTK